MSYLHTVGKAGSAVWEVVAGSPGPAGAGDTSGSSGSCVPWAGEEGLARCWDEELWPPRVFSMSRLNEEGFAGIDGFCRGRGGGGGGGVGLVFRKGDVGLARRVISYLKKNRM